MTAAVVEAETSRCAVAAAALEVAAAVVRTSFYVEAVVVVVVAVRVFAGSSFFLTAEAKTRRRWDSS